MDFDLTEEQQLLKTNVRAYLDREIAPQAAEHEKRGQLTREELIGFIKQLMPWGYYNGRASEEFGGSNLDAKTFAVLQEELSRAWAGLAGAVWIAGGSGSPSGVPERYLPELKDRMRAGESISCGMITEPDHGSDSSRVETRAVLDGDEWVVTGTKTFISNGPVADHGTVNLTIDPAAGRDGVRTIFVHREESPFETVRQNHLLGLRAWPNGELRFDEVRVPRQNLRERNIASPEGKRVWHFETPRTTLAIMAVGIAQASIDASVKFARERHQFGRPIGSFQLVQEMIVDMVIETECARMLTFRAMDLQDKNRDSSWESSIAKAYATEMGVRVTSKAIEVHGGVGLIDEMPLGRYFRDARSLTIPDGTTEIQKLVAGRRILGISAIN